MEKNALEIKSRNKTLGGLREEQRVHDEALAEVRKGQAKARTNVTQKERKIKKAEKALEVKVRAVRPNSPDFIDVSATLRNRILLLQRLKLLIRQENLTVHRQTVNRRQGVLRNYRKTSES